jgi:hypothetical protein
MANKRTELLRLFGYAQIRLQRLEAGKLLLRFFI